MFLFIDTLVIFVCTIKVKGTQITLSEAKDKIIECKIAKRIFDEEDFFTNENWFLEIPKIGLKAQIEYGTTKEVMDTYIGHFDNTNLWTGNIGLAAHNRGYPVNYFGRLKELQEGDEIKYTTIFGIKTYKVELITVIEDTDWSYLEKTNDNRITLITCVENRPNYRRCIQGKEI